MLENIREGFKRIVAWLAPIGKRQANRSAKLEAAIVADQRAIRVFLIHVP